MNFGADWGYWKKLMANSSIVRAYVLSTFNKLKWIRTSDSEFSIIYLSSSQHSYLWQVPHIFLSFFSCTRETENYQKDNTLFQMTLFVPYLFIFFFFKKIYHRLGRLFPASGTDHEFLFFISDGLFFLFGVIYFRIDYVTSKCFTVVLLVDNDKTKRYWLPFFDDSAVLYAENVKKFLLLPRTQTYTKNIVHPEIL